MKGKHRAARKASVLFLSLFVLVLMAFTTAHATTLGPITTTTPISSTLTDWSNNLSFAQFNPSLGTLTSVELDLTSALTTSLTLTNTSDTLGASGKAFTEVQISVGTALGLFDVPQIDQNSPKFTFNVGASGSASSGVHTFSGESTSLYNLSNVSSSVLSAFTGTGNISLPASTFTQTWIQYSSGNVNQSQVTNASLTGDVIYTYTPAPVPLPSALILLGPGLFGLVGLRRRFKG
jgi:hypothetical protein